MYNLYINAALYDFDIDNDDDNTEIDQDKRLSLHFELYLPIPSKKHLRGRKRKRLLLTQNCRDWETNSLTGLSAAAKYMKRLWRTLLHPLLTICLYASSHTRRPMGRLSEKKSHDTLKFFVAESNRMWKLKSQQRNQRQMQYGATYSRVRH